LKLKPLIEYFSQILHAYSGNDTYQLNEDMQQRQVRVSKRAQAKVAESVPTSGVNGSVNLERDMRAVVSGWMREQRWRSEEAWRQQLSMLWRRPASSTTNRARWHPHLAPH